MTRTGAVVTIGALLTLLSACSPPWSHEGAHGTDRIATPSAAPGSLGICPAARDLSALPVLAHLGGDVDDLFAAPDATLWVTDVQGRVLRLGTDGAVLSITANSGAPEGIVALADGTAIIVEQARDRLVSLHPPARADDVKLVATIPQTASRHDIDGIALDAGRSRVLIPDPARGALHAVSIRGGPLTTVASGLDQPVAVAVAPAGEIYVAQRSGAGLMRIVRDGDQPRPLGITNGVDEVVAGSHLLYISRDRTVAAFDPQSGEARILVRGVNSQGLALLPGGRLAIGDATTNTITTTPACEQ